MRKLSLLLLLVTNVLLSQNLSPTASSLGVYGEVPVSHFTGVPNISIPLHTVSVDKDNNIPISVNYHIRDVKPSTPPGVIGLGWSIQAGGVISRKMNHVRDEGYYRTHIHMFKPKSNFYGAPNLVSSSVKSKGFYDFDKTMLKSSNWNSRDNLKKAITTNSKLTPDEFFFNFLGKSGKFVLNENNQWVIVDSSEPLKVTFNNKFVESVAPVVGEYVRYPLYRLPDRGVSKTFEEFTIIDGKGIKYIFGGLDAIEYSLGLGVPLIGLTANSWFLNKILYPNGKEVKFKYKRYNIDATVFNETQYRHFDNLRGMSRSLTYNQDSGDMIYSVHLDKIITSHEIVEFKYSVSKSLKYSGYDILKPADQIRWKKQLIAHYVRLAELDGRKELDGYHHRLPRYQPIKLKEITVKSQYSKKNINKVQFGYIENTKERLKLKSMYIGNNQYKNYSFDYNALKMPHYLKAGTDHWGYYNRTDIENGNRTPSEKYSKAETLESITYPTKGEVDFEWELNTYSKIATINNNRMSLSNKSGKSGGLRIKSITKNDNSKIETINYGYNNSGECSGIPGYVFSGVAKALAWDVRNGKFSSEFPVRVVLGRKKSPLFFMSNNSLGSHTGYSKVTESSSLNGRVEMLFSNYSGGFLDDSENGHYNKESCYLPYLNSNGKKRGKLIQKNMYNNSSKLLFSEIIDYKKINDKFSRTINRYYWHILNYNGDKNFIASAFANKHYLYQYLPSRKRTIVHSPSGNLTTTEEYKYNDKGLLSEVKTRNSNNRITSNSYRYVSDIFRRTSKPTSYSNVIKKMYNDNLISYPIEETQSVNGKVVHSTLYNYDLFGIFDVKNSGIQVAKLSSTDVLKNPISTNFTPAYFSSDGRFIKNSNYIKDILYERYDSYGNLHLSRKKDGMATVYFWGYHGGKIIAKIEGIQSSTMSNYGLRILDRRSNQDSDKEREKALRDLLNLHRTRPGFTSGKFTIYTYDPLIGVTSITDARGETVYYHYDDFNRLKYIKDSESNILKEYNYNYKN